MKNSSHGLVRPSIGEAGTRFRSWPVRALETVEMSVGLMCDYD